MSGLRIVAAVEDGDGPPVYPLPAHASAAQFRTVNFQPHRWIGSALATEGSWEPRAVASWLRLWSHAFVTQTPAGTLPVCDRRLADLAGFGRDLVAWGAVRGVVLAGWTPVRALEADGSDAGLRLACPETTAEAVRLWAAAEEAEAKRVTERLDKARQRVRKQLVALGARRESYSDDRVEAMRAWLAARGMRGTRANVEAAMLAVMRGGFGSG